MIFVTGPLYAGKKTFLCRALGWTDEEFARKAVRDVQDLARGEEDLTALADRLAGHEAVLATEVGAGVVPADPEERRARERAGRLGCLLAERADTVVRVVCGLPQFLKGQLP